jgi:hypothetical protein
MLSSVYVYAFFSFMTLKFLDQNEYLSLSAMRVIFLACHILLALLSLSTSLWGDEYEI